MTINHFKKARIHDSESAEIVWNLAEAHLALAQTKEAAELFQEMEGMGVLGVELLNKTANIMLGQNDLSGAIDMLNWSLKVCPDQEILHPMMEVISSKLKETQPE